MFALMKAIVSNFSVASKQQWDTGAQISRQREAHSLTHEPTAVGGDGRTGWGVPTELGAALHISIS